MASIVSILKIVLAFASQDAVIRIVQQLVAYLLNLALKKYIRKREKGDDLARWAKLAEHVGEASAVFSQAVADSEVTDEEADACREALQRVLAAWADGEPTPADFKDRVEE